MIFSESRIDCPCDNGGGGIRIIENLFGRHNEIAQPLFGNFVAQAVFVAFNPRRTQIIFRKMVWRF